MDILGAIIGGFFALIMFMVLGYIFGSNPGLLLVVIGVLLAVGILVKTVIEKSFPHDSPWED